MTRKALELLLVLSLAGAQLSVEPVELSAQSTAGAGEGALFLLLPVGARGVALGRTMTWVPGAEGAFWNPAGLAGVSRSQAMLFSGRHDAGVATAASTMWVRPGTGTMAVSYMLLDAGDIDQRDQFGTYTGKITIRNHLGVLSAAGEPIPGVSAGISFKMIRFQLSCRGICTDEGTTATTYAVDLGVQAVTMDRVRVGAMLAHLGPKLQVRNADQADALPARVRLAVAYNVAAGITDSDDLHGWVAVEVEDGLHSIGSKSLYIGTELSGGTDEMLSLRAGWVFSEFDERDGGRVGLGLRYERFDLSVAKSLVRSTLQDTEPVFVTFSIDF